MAYFTCEHGSRYFPFGRGGRDKLLRGLSGTARSSGHVLDQLQTCPMQSLPLVIEPELVERKSKVSVVGVVHECHGGCAHNESPEFMEFEDEHEFVAPIVLREPHSESSQIYNMLANDVLGEIFKSQTDAILVRM
jgi:hypothetical protein